MYDEGLVATLGVPLLAGGEVIGVLFASDRKVRPFTRDEVALLSSLATHVGPDWHSPDRAPELQLALRLHRLR